MTEYKEPQDMLKELRELVNSQSDIRATEDPTRLLTLLRDKIYQMLRSPLKEDYAAEVFGWVAHLCLSTGDISWISTDARWTEHEAKIFSHVARLSLSEMHMVLPLIQRHLACGNEPEKNDDGKIISRSADSNDYDRFGNHLIIIESTIKSLLKHQSEDTEDNDLTRLIKPGELKSLLEHLKETLSLILDYLEVVHRYWDQVNSKSEEDRPKIEAAQGALRLMSIWLAEEPDSFSCDRFMIQLMIKSLTSSDWHSGDDMLITALHAVCMSDKKMFDALHAIPESRTALDSYLELAKADHAKKKDKTSNRRNEKMFKLRLGLIKDLLEFYS